MSIERSRGVVQGPSGGPAGGSSLFEDTMSVGIPGSEFQKFIPTVAFCSSEEEHFSVGELAKPIPSTRGWHSTRRCTFPQEIGLRFAGEVFLEQLQILANESKVPSRIDVYVCEATQEVSRDRAFPQYDTAAFRRLGYVCFHSNADGQYKSGELRSVRLGCEVLYLKLLIWEPFEHPLNFFNQVGLAAVHCIGSLLKSYMPSDHFPHARANSAFADLNAPRDPSTMRLHPANTPLERLQLDLTFDLVIIEKIKELSMLKEKAMREENFDLAKRVKIQVEGLYPLGAQIQQLEKRKKRAMLEEDFQLAHLVKGEIEELRAQAGAYRPAGYAPGRELALPAPSAAQHQEYGGATGGHGGGPSNFLSPSPIRGGSQENTPDRLAGASGNYGAEPQLGGGGGFHSSAPMQQQVPQSYNPHDETPAVATGVRTVNGGLGGGGGGTYSAVLKNEGPMVDTVRLPDYDRTMSDLIHQKVPQQTPPEVLTDTEYTGYQDMESAFGVYATSCLFSKRFQLRESAMRVIAERGDEVLQHVSADMLLDTVVLYLGGNKGFGIADPIASAFFASSDAMQKVVTRQFSGNSDSSMRNHGAGAIDRLVDRLGDSNSKVASTCRDLLLGASKLAGVGSEKITASVLSRKGKSFKVVCDQIAVISKLLVQTPLGHIEQHVPSLTLSSVYNKLALPGLSHAHNEARERSMEFVLLLRTKFGADAVDPLIDKLKPAQQKAIEAKLEAGGGAPSAPPEEIDQDDDGGFAHPNTGTGKRHPPRPRQKIKAAQDKDAKVNPEGDESLLIPYYESVEDQPLEGGGGASPKKTGFVEKKRAAKAPARRQPPKSIPGQCQFCKLADEDFYDHQELVQHFMAECPMLCTCPLCKLPVEIREVHWHLTEDCQHKRRLQQCPRCLEAVRDTEYDEHVANKQCTAYEQGTQVCPLCHERMPDGEAFWEAHVLTPPFCPSNPRTAAPS